MDIRCKRCGAQLPAENVNVNTMVAKCRACNAVFSFADQVQPAGVVDQRSQLDVPMPAKFTVEHAGGALQVRWRWFSIVTVFLTVFAVFWNGFLCVWVGVALAAGAGGFALFSLLHVAAGIAIAYLALTGFVNHTLIYVRFGELTVRHGPLPWVGNLTLPTDAVRQLYCVERVRRNRRSNSISYEVQIAKADGTGQALVKGLETQEQALYLEQAIERFLGIKDERMAGELRK